MFLKRILEKQLELNDEGNPAWGENTNYYNGKIEEKDIYNLSNKGSMSFIEQIRVLSNSHSTEKLIVLKSKIEEKARTSTERKIKFNDNLYDSNVIESLRQEGFNVIETNDARDGDFITVSW